MAASLKNLVVHAEGLGNIVQILPLLSLLDRQLGPTDLALASSSFGVARGLFPGRRVFLPGEVVPQEDYVGKICTIWGNIHGKGIAPDLPILNSISEQQMSLATSEVSVYLRAGLEQGIDPKHIEYDCSALIGHKPSPEYFEVVISNGYNWKGGDLWKAKSYPRYPDVVKSLQEKGLKVCSIGAPQEFVEGTVDRTGIGLEESLGLIKNCKVLLSNDSGFYHCACAMRKPVVVIFTFTSIVKNNDPHFHDTAVVVRNPVTCHSTCHAKMMWSGCPTHECRDIDPKIIVEAVLSSSNRLA